MVRITSLGETDTLEKAQFAPDIIQTCYPGLNQATPALRRGSLEAVAAGLRHRQSRIPQTVREALSPKRQRGSRSRNTSLALRAQIVMSFATSAEWNHKYLSDKCLRWILNSMSFV
jgi:hypothetical protein